MDENLHFSGLAAPIFAALIGVLTSRSTAAQSDTSLTDAAKDARRATEKELESIAIIDRKVMIPMRDGIHIPGGHLPPKGYFQKVSDYMGTHSIQLQLLGHWDACPAGHDECSHRS